ncbi:hypothetical protein SDC9_101995 [bioreactor metagenome]|uniref:Uncharacterized protein n=1 Tax=bioreactor metagenome TaxID=1076179 RepID=A0A645APL3_9ZZZZ
MTPIDEDERPQESTPISPDRLRKVWLTVLLMLAGGCVSAVLITLLISWAFGLGVHLP